jgi:1-aminocyclopropane-1-carboxylate deaminase
MSLFTQNCRIDRLSPFYKSRIPVDVLRLDAIHPVVSGNKWFKLKEYLKEASQTNKKTVLTYGGAYSNHIVATAAAAQIAGLKSIGIIRGEEPPVLSHTLLSAADFGMKFYFISREAYKLKTVPREVYQQYAQNDIYEIPEGGYGKKGMLGAKDIILQNETSSYTHFIAAVGTGTTLAGIIDAALPHQKIIGISVLKNAYSLQKEIESLLPKEKYGCFELLHDYHFGGYAKHTKELFRFMNEFYETTGIPTDFAYTAKALYAVSDLLEKSYFNSNDKLLFVHTGGLQGNFSLPKGTLIFP